MMYTKKSSPLSLIKYLAAIPALILSIFLFASHTSGIELDNNKENNNSEVIYGSSEILFASVDTTPPPKPPIPPKPPKAQKSINALKGIQPPVPPEPPSSMKVNRPVAPVKPNLPPTPPFPNKMEKPPTPDMPPSPPPAPKKYQNMEQPFTEVDQLPRFPGCEDMNATEKEKSSCSKKKLIQYIYQNISYPEEARKAGIQGTVVVQFVVKKDGTLEDITLLRDIGGGCGEASHHIIASMNEMEERWVPGKHEGKSVDVMYTIPVKFTLENGSGKNDNKGSNENKEKGEIKKEDDSIVGFNPNNGSLMIIDKDKIEPLIILDGKETQRGVSSIHPDDIATINVLKGKTAFEKYGQKGENGVIEITTKNGNKKKISFSADKVVLDKNKVILEGNAKVEDKGIELKADKINYYSISESDNSIDKENSPLIVLDGIVVGNDTSIYKEIDPQQIKEINVLKGESALSKYGQKGINGVVEISRKKHLKKSELSETNNNIIFLSDVKIFPNPSKGEINISFNGPANPLEIQIHAIDGKLLHTEKESDFDGTFNKTIRNKNFVNTQAIVSFIQDGKVQSEKIVFHE